MVKAFIASLEISSGSRTPDPITELIALKVVEIGQTCRPRHPDRSATESLPLSSIIRASYERRVRQYLERGGRRGTRAGGRPPGLGCGPWGTSRRSFFSHDAGSSSCGSRPVRADQRSIASAARSARPPRASFRSPENLQKNPGYFLSAGTWTWRPVSPDCIRHQGNKAFTKLHIRTDR